MNVSSMDRSAGRISITVGKDMYSPPLPYELHGYVTAETWESRSLQIRRLCGKYSKPLLERIWFCVALLVTLILPLVLYSVILRSLLPQHLKDVLNSGERPPISNSDQSSPDGRDGRFKDGQDLYDYSLKARGITFGITIGLFILFWGPLIFWKRMGTFQAKKLANKWTADDGSATPGSFVPLWTIKTPGVFTITGRYFISIPPAAQPSIFHPDAYLPPYLYQQAMLQQQSGGWQQQQQRPLDDGITIGDRRGAPVYTPPPGGVPTTLTDEKNRDDFVDVRV